MNNSAFTNLSSPEVSPGTKCKCSEQPAMAYVLLVLLLILDEALLLKPLQLLGSGPGWLPGLVCPGLPLLHRPGHLRV